MPTLEERVSALETIVRNNELNARENYNGVRREVAELGGLCAKSFLAVHHQLDRMETRMNTMDQRFDGMDSRFASLEVDMSAVRRILNQQFGSST
jgi:phage shock protein A